MSDINKILKNGYGLLLAYDHGFENGPVDFDEKSVDPNWILEIADSGCFTGFVCQKGIASKYYSKSPRQVPLIVKLNGRTSYHKEEEPLAFQHCSVDEAISYGAVAVGYTIYIGSEHEQQMICEFGKIEKEAREKGILSIAWMHPLGVHIQNDTEKDVLAYAARVGLELNADAIITKYTGDVGSYSWVVKNAGESKVFVVGGPRMDTPYQLLDTAHKIKEAGASGFAIGRNIWQAKDPLSVAKQLSDILYG